MSCLFLILKSVEHTVASNYVPFRCPKKLRLCCSTDKILERRIFKESGKNMLSGVIIAKQEKKQKKISHYINSVSALYQPYQWDSFPLVFFLTEML